MDVTPDMRTTTAVARDAQALQAAVAGWKAAGERVALVPTMGALHAGHLSLVEQARRAADRVVVSIFVNPTQFGPNEDFDRYPRDEARDIARLKKRSVDLIYLPEARDIYPDGPSTSVSAGRLAEPLCGRFRPGHFDGVATVVVKLFSLVRPDTAIFGEKDYQQLLVIRRVAEEQNIPVKILAGPTIREDDGLAFSSRNALLSDEARARATVLPRTIGELARRALLPDADLVALEKEGIAALEAAGFDKVDYLEFRSGQTLERSDADDPALRLFAAAHIDGVRLIDNLAVHESARPAG